MILRFYTGRSYLCPAGCRERCLPRGLQGSVALDDLQGDLDALLHILLGIALIASVGIAAAGAQIRAGQTHVAQGSAVGAAALTDPNFGRVIYAMCKSVDPIIYTANKQITTQEVE